MSEKYSDEEYSDEEYSNEKYSDEDQILPWFQENIGCETDFCIDLLMLAKLEEKRRIAIERGHQETRIHPSCDACADIRHIETLKKNLLDDLVKILHETRKECGI
jgi:hypothetical protein